MKLIMYADDGIIMSNEPITFEKVSAAFQERGLTVEPEKSREITDELQFLGFRLSPQGFQSNTRSGVKMLLSKDEIANLDWAMALKAIQKEVAEFMKNPPEDAEAQK